ncbi:hypothetical protein RHCRD62_40042 [Rhodococcus sp. RD6.2]|nr:hypothetical protein RHCRD62_40042 [Rhodococcus sp. RD6.2]
MRKRVSREKREERDVVAGGRWPGVFTYRGEAGGVSSDSGRGRAVRHRRGAGRLVATPRGAAAALDAVRDRGLARAFLTNTTSSGPARLRHGGGCRGDRHGRRAQRRVPPRGPSGAALPADQPRRHRRGHDRHRVRHRQPGGGGPRRAGPEFDHAALSRVVELMLDGVPAIAIRGGLTWASAKGIRIDTGARSARPSPASSTIMKPCRQRSRRPLCIS